MGSFNQAGLFLVGTIFDLYIWIVLLRIMLQWIRADYFNPLSQLVIKLTDAPVKLVHKILPYKSGPDFGALVFAFFLTLIKIALLLVLMRLPFGAASLFVYGIFDLVQQVLSLYFYILLIVIISSWVSSKTVNPIINVLTQLVNPILVPIRKFIPPIAGFDFSPLAVMIVIKLIEIFLLRFTAGL